MKNSQKNSIFSGKHGWHPLRKYKGGIKFFSKMRKQGGGVFVMNYTDKNLMILPSFSACT